MSDDSENVPGIRMSRTDKYFEPNYDVQILEYIRKPNKSEKSDK